LLAILNYCVGFSPKSVRKITKTVVQDSHMHAKSIAATDLMHFLHRYVASHHRGTSWADSHVYIEIVNMERNSLHCPVLRSAESWAFWFRHTVCPFYLFPGQGSLIAWISPHSPPHPATGGCYQENDTTENNTSICRNCN
jgi:hypothetical protein